MHISVSWGIICFLCLIIFELFGVTFGVFPLVASIHVGITSTRWLYSAPFLSFGEFCDLRFCGRVVFPCHAMIFSYRIFFYLCLRSLLFGIPVMKKQACMLAFFSVTQSIFEFWSKSCWMGGILKFRGYWADECRAWAKLMVHQLKKRIMGFVCCWRIEAWK